eukprot:7678802-Heterocapsa_arctica.AAC.1
MVAKAVAAALSSYVPKAPVPLLKVKLPIQKDRVPTHRAEHFNIASGGEGGPPEDDDDDDDDDGEWDVHDYYDYGDENSR